MTASQIEALDSVAARISELRAATRQALISGDQDRTREIQGQLKSTESAWHALIDTAPAAAGPAELTTEPAAGPAELTTEPAAGFALPAREQIHRVLSLIGVPARPMFIVQIHNALFPGQLGLSSFTSVRRDEERSWNASKGPRRPFYIVPALSVDDLTPVRALLALSTWEPEKRIVGPLSDRADFFAVVTAVAYAVMNNDAAQNDPDHPAYALLEGLAGNLGMIPDPGKMFHPAEVIATAQGEYQKIGPQDEADRRRGARLLSQLSPAEQLFGKTLTT